MKMMTNKVATLLAVVMMGTALPAQPIDDEIADAEIAETTEATDSVDTGDPYLERLLTTHPDSLTEDERMIVEALLLSDVPDSMAVDTLVQHTYRMHLMTRSYADNIFIRWAPDEYVPWRILNYWGYHVIRVHQDKADLKVDTLGLVKPLSMEQFMETFEANDTLAAAAAQIIYGKRTEMGNTEAHPGSMASIVELMEEQQMVYSYAMLIAERRRDIAVAMGLAFEDRTALPKRKYDYILEPAVPDSILAVNSYILSADPLGSWKPQDFHTTMTDSLDVPSTLKLYWPRMEYFTAFDIERRCISRGGDWVKLNDKPYIMMTDEAYDTGYNIYADEMLHPGTYEYRIRAYDAFGDPTAPCEPHRVEMPDLIPPAAPLLKRIEIIRYDDSPRVEAQIYIEKETIEEDLMGYIPFYQNEKYANSMVQSLIDSLAMQLSDEQKRLLGEGRMIPLVKEPVPPTDTVFTIDVTGLESGTLIILATDTALNMNASLAMPIHIADFNPPAPPTRLRAAMDMSGLLMMNWSPSTAVDVEGYEIYWANDPSHPFLQVTGFYSADTLFVDTLSMRTAEPYRYYYVKARDYAGNASLSSDTLRVERLTNIPPQPCRVDSLWMTPKAVHMQWYPSPESDVLRYYVYRRLQDSKEWQLIRTLTPDSLVSNRLYIVDHPEPNMTKRYYYAIETINRSGLSSGMSVQTSFLFKGEVILPVSIKLFGHFNEDTQKVQLAWEIKGLTDEIRKDAYLVISRKRPGDEFFRFLKSVSVNDTHTIDHNILPGEEAEYEMRLRTNEGRFSPYSNRVQVKNAVKE